MQAIPVPTLPTYNAPAYTPPAQDDGEYTQARGEAIAPGLREMRQGLRESISVASSLDNPAAKSQFIRQAMKGYGAGLDKVSAGAGREAQTRSDKKYAQELNNYRIQYDAKSDNYLRNYQNQINTIAAEFAQQQQINSQNYAAGIDTGGGLSTSQRFAQRAQQIQM
jgi:hypothetical protein